MNEELIKELEEKIEKLEYENQDLRKQLEEDIAPAIKRRLSKEEEDKIVEYYKSHCRRITHKGLEKFILETGIQISDNGFRNVLKRRGVYRKSKKKSVNK